MNLTRLTKNENAIILKIDESFLPIKSGLINGEVEARLLEMGFIEGAKIKVLHLGWGKDPIAVRINNSNTVIALRKNEAAAILVKKTN